MNITKCKPKPTSSPPPFLPLKENNKQTKTHTTTPKRTRKLMTGLIINNNTKHQAMRIFYTATMLK